MSILSLLVALLILCAVIWAVQKIVSGFKIEDPMASVITVVVVLCALVLLLNQFGLFGGPIRLR